MSVPWPSAGRLGGSAIHPPFDLGKTYDRYAAMLFSIAYSVVCDRADAEDCVHDTLLKIWRNERAYDPERGELKSFLAVAVRNAAITMRRDRLRHTAIEKRLPEAPATTDPDMPDYLERSSLQAALRSLPPEQWSVLRLAYFGYLTHVEIAQRLELPLGTVKSRISLAIRRLHDLMPPRGETQ